MKTPPSSVTLLPGLCSDLQRKRRPFARAAALLMLVAFGIAAPSAPAAGESSVTQIELGGAFSSAPGVRLRNLEIFAITGPDQIIERDYLTLAEAMEKKLVRVVETKNVSELKIENASPDRHVFIQAGDIVKGGQQDRCLTTDVVLPPKSGAQPIASFCVEQGRWQQRAGESVAAFSKSDKQIVTKGQRYAVKAAKQQRAVWSEVEKSKKALTSNVARIAGSAVDVEANASPSSLQLALENRELSGMVKELRDGAMRALPDRPDVIGVAYAVNGKLVNAEIYGNAKLFAKLRDKVLEAAATEAIADLKAGAVEEPAVSEAALREFLDPTALTEGAVVKPNAQTEWREREAKDRALFESRDSDFKAALCHRNVIVADESVKASVQADGDGKQGAIRLNRVLQNEQSPAPEQRRSARQ